MGGVSGVLRTQASSGYDATMSAYFGLTGSVVSYRLKTGNVNALCIYISEQQEWVSIVHLYIIRSYNKPCYSWEYNI